MHTSKSHPNHRSGLGLLAKSWALPALLAVAALATPNRAAAANPFAATTLTPATQTVNVGAPCSVDIVFTLPAGGYNANGIQAWLKFDQTKLQVVSVTPNAASPFGTVFANSFDNTTGTLTFGATGGTVANTAVTVAKVTFNPIAAGSAALTFQNVNQYISGSPYGVNGLASGGSVTVNPAVVVFASGISPVIAWDPIYPAQAFPNWTTESKPIPTVGYDAAWVNPHPASVFPKGIHPWEFIPPMNFDAHWINAWSNISSQGPAGQSWTKYSTTVTGEGDFVLQFLADNASWIYIDGNLVGYQDQDWTHTATGRYTIHLTGAGPHELSFIIWDGGGAAGGKFRLETTQSFLDNNPGTPLPPPPAPSDSTPPVITAPANLTAEATSAAGATVSFSATAVDDVDGPVSVTADPASGSVFPLGTTTVDLAAVDAAGNGALASFTVTVQDTIAPVLTLPLDVTAEATSAAGAAVSYAAATATDAVGVTSLTYSAASGSTFALGTTAVTVGASDAAGNASTGTFSVTVQDTTAPVITAVTPSIRSIWPPNKKFVPVTVSVTATDAVGIASAKIISVATNQPDRRTQWQITGPLAVSLLADRHGDDQDRVYTITVEVRDAAGNVSTQTTTVTVPHDQREKHGDDDHGDDHSDGHKEDGKKNKKGKGD